MMHALSQRRRSTRRYIWSGDLLCTQPLVADVKKTMHLLRGRVLDLGCGNRPYAELFPPALAYIAYDLDTRGSLPDVAGTALSLPFVDASFDAVFSTQVLEHVPEPLVMLREIERVLRPGGVLICSAPQYWRLHEEPHDFFRYTRYGLTYLLQNAGFEVQTMQAEGGVWRLVGQAINNAVYERFGATVPARLIFTVSNVAALAMERIWLDEADTLNYMVYATKPITVIGSR